MDPRCVATHKLLFDHEGDITDARNRDYSAAELDAIADFSWPWEGLQRAAVTSLHGIRRHWQRMVATLRRGPLRVHFHPR